jgi:PAS domain S-box-containing protein
MTISATKKFQPASLISLILLALSCVLWSNRATLSLFKVPASLPIHTALETVTIIIFSSVFIVCWNAFGENRKKSSVILGVAFLCTSILGFFHAISFQGMPGFLTAMDMHKSLVFWLVSRFIVAATLFGLALDLNDSRITTRQSYSVLVLGLLVTAGGSFFVFIFPQWLPVTYIEGLGQTTFKIYCELVLIAMNLVTSILLYRQFGIVEVMQCGEHLQIKRVYLFLASSMLAMSEIYFTLHTTTNDLFIVVGHAFQLLSALAIYLGMVAVNIHAPYTILSNATKSLESTTEKLTFQKKRLTGIIEAAIDGIITVDEKQLIVLINPAAAAIFGYSVETLMGESLNKVIPARHREVHGSHVRQFGKTGTTRRIMGAHFEDFYVTGLKADGTEFPLEASISAITENEQRYYTVIFRDITERKLARERQEQYQSQLSQLSSALQSIREEERKHIARELHDDLGQLLAALRMDLSLLQRDTLITAKSQKTINSMDQLMLTSITTLRRIATDLRPRALDEGGLFFALQTLKKDFSVRHGIDCELIASEEQLALDDAHSTAIFRIVQESLTNVARHANASEVQIVFSRNDNALNFSIADNGRGIGEGDMQKSRSFGLVGMRERVKAMQGDFNLTSTPGEGTHLEISIPLTGIGETLK